LVLGLIIEECILLAGARRGAILSYDSRLRPDLFRATKALSDKELGRISSTIDGIVREVIDKKGRASALKDATWSRGEVRSLFKKRLRRYVKKGLIICPIRKKGELLGVVVVADKIKGAFTRKDTENLAIICQESAIVLENIKLFRAKIRNERMAAIGQTMAGISHYIKNILQGISSGSHLLSAGIESEDMDTVGEAWRIVDKNTKRISDLIMDMLYYSKERRPPKRRVDPMELVGDVIDLAEPELKERGIALKIFAKDVPAAVTLDEKSVHRAILNLVSNARDACDKPHSFIRVDLVREAASGMLKITVSDNGKGIPREEREKVFQPFFTSKSGGTGLGLAITRKVAEEHGGSLTVRSEPGEGSSFEMAIPA
jgi:signal transduction histidine kinase